MPMYCTFFPNRENHVIIIDKDRIIHSELKDNNQIVSYLDDNRSIPEEPKNEEEEEKLTEE
jgi:hypothetical protein